MPFTHRLYSAKPPTILDVPLEMKWDAVGEPDPYTPVGAKGIGEAAFSGAIGSVICAIQDAMGEVAFNRTPIMTDMILNMLEDKPQPYGALSVHV
jgi:CO/xanthine dehydrogenase Mo-binding subunit